MKTITEIHGGAQALMDINFNLQKCFEEQLTNEYKTFLYLLREAETYLPVYIRSQAKTRRPPMMHKRYQIFFIVVNRFLSLTTIRGMIKTGLRLTP